MFETIARVVRFWPFGVCCRFSGSIERLFDWSDHYITFGSHFDTTPAKALEILSNSEQPRGLRSRFKMPENERVLVRPGTRSGSRRMSQSRSRSPIAVCQIVGENFDGHRTVELGVPCSIYRAHP